jgi:hypothetical protein
MPSSTATTGPDSGSGVDQAGRRAAATSII